MKSLVIAMLMATPIHDTWGNGTRVDPATKDLCCGRGDCHEINSTRVQLVPGGYVVYLTDAWPHDMRWGGSGPPEGNVVVPSDRAQISPDGSYWLCYWQNRFRCFFAPMFN